MHVLVTMLRDSLLYCFWILHGVEHELDAQRMHAHGKIFSLGGLMKEESSYARLQMIHVIFLTQATVNRSAS